MIRQEILDTFVFETVGGDEYGVTNPLEHDEIIGYYPTRAEAEKAFMDYVEANDIIFEI